MIAANLVPLIGVLFFRWDVGTILILYWLENGIVGLLTIPRILLARGPSPLGARISLGFATNIIQALFFVVNYGVFWFIHGIFVVLLTGQVAGPGFPNPVEQMSTEPALVLATVALLLGHGADLVLNYIGRGEYRNASSSGELLLPYPRMVTLHVTIIFGALAVAILGQAVGFVALLVVVKTLLDISLYLRQRRRAVTAQAGRTVAI